MHKTTEAHYENGKIICKEPIPLLKRARLLIAILEEEPLETHLLARFKGILKTKVDGLEYQKKMRSEWDEDVAPEVVKSLIA